MISLVYNHNVFSHFLADQVNAADQPAASAGLLVPLARHAANSVTLSYLAHIVPGVYWGAGVGFTDNPSIEYFRNEGNSLNFTSTLTVVF
jgi:porin